MQTVQLHQIKKKFNQERSAKMADYYVYDSHAQSWNGISITQTIEEIRNWIDQKSPYAPILEEIYQIMTNTSDSEHGNHAKLFCAFEHQINTGASFIEFLQDIRKFESIGCTIDDVCDAWYNTKSY